MVMGRKNHSGRVGRCRTGRRRFDVGCGQEDTLRCFREGDAGSAEECNLLVATSIGEEGLNFPACSVVIRYDRSPLILPKYLMIRIPQMMLSVFLHACHESTFRKTFASEESDVVSSSETASALCSIQLSLFIMDIHLESCVPGLSRRM